MARQNNAYSVITSFYDPINKDRSLKELNKKFLEMYTSVKGRMDTLSIDPRYNTVEGEPMPGGRRRKSRQYKKRRSTLRRRRVKGRRTRKGKKRRSTKRRR
jgi:hypothetical protein